MESVKLEVSFMSGLDSLYLGTIGLLGEYSPISRKRYILSLESFMHHRPLQHCTSGCSFMQPSGTEEKFPEAPKEKHFALASAAYYL